MQVIYKKVWKILDTLRDSIQRDFNSQMFIGLWDQCQCRRFSKEVQRSHENLL